MWSVAVLDPAPPPRTIPESASPEETSDRSRWQRSGWKPNVFGRRFRCLLVAVGDHDRGVDVEAELFAEVGSCARRPCLGSRHCPTLAKKRRVPLAHPVEHPPGGRRGGDRPEQLGLVTEHLEIADRIRAAGDRDGHVAEDTAREVDRQGLVRPEQRRVPGGSEPGELRHLPQQLGACVRDHALTIRGHPDSSETRYASP